MNNIQLYLNDYLADLSDDHPIALTFQINDLAEVKNQQGNTSNQFKLPLTQNNRIILGYADDISFCETTLTPQIPYTKMSARIIQNGIEILPNAIAEINQVDNDTAGVTILSGNVDFFDALGGQIADMGDSTSQWSNYGNSLPWKPFDHVWNLENVAKSQGHTEQDGWIYPIVDYGLLPITDFTHIDARNQRPGFFIKKAVDLLIQSTGYKATGSLLADPLYPLLIAQFSNSNFDHGIDYENQPDIKGILVSNITSQTEQFIAGDNNNPNTGIINFDNVIFDPSNFFKNNVYTPDEVISVEATLIIPKLYFYGHIRSTDASNLNIYITLLDSNATVQLGSYNVNFDNGYVYTPGDGSGSNKFVSVTVQNIKLSVSTDLSPTTAEGLRISYEFDGLSHSNFTLYPGASFQVTPQNQGVKFSQTVQCERILPDMSQKDFLKDTFQRFGIMCQTDVYNKTINFACLRDIINNIPIANDWTSKCIDQGKQINYKLGNYAQVNNLEYQTDPNIQLLKFGWDQLIINDQTLNSVATDLIVSKFGPSLNRPYVGGTIAQITMIDATSNSTDFTISVAPRLLVDQKIDLRDYNNATITFIDGTSSIVINDTISVPYFYKPDGAYNLCWCDMDGLSPGQKLPGLKTKYYSDLQKILQNTKLLIRYFLLTPRDIAALNLLVPIYLQQHNAYFYINKIDSWRKGQPCKVELVRIG